MTKEKEDGFGGVEDRKECEQVNGDCKHCHNENCPASVCSEYEIFLEE
jgi:hypothetical protein